MRVNRMTTPGVPPERAHLAQRAEEEITVVVSDRVAGGTSFEDFVESALPRLVRFAAWVGEQPADAEDLVQDALVRVGARSRHRHTAL